MRQIKAESTRRLILFVLTLGLVLSAGFTARAASLNKKVMYFLENQTRTLSLLNGGKDAVWSSTDEKIATVNQKGVITARQKGNCLVKVTTGGKTLSCRIVVDEPTINLTSKVVSVGDQIPLKIKGTKRKILWESDHEKIIHVADTGKCYAFKPGKAKVTARLTAGVTLSCSFTVWEDADMAEQYRPLVKSLTASLSTDQEKCLVLARYICEHASYVLTNSQDLFSLLKTGVGQCMHYSYAYQMFLQLAGVECDFVYSEKANHSWNQVRVDGYWYNVDLTGLDEEDKRLNYAYFMVSDDFFWVKTARTDDYHECVSRRYDFVRPIERVDKAGDHVIDGISLADYQLCYESNPWANYQWRKY